MKANYKSHQPRFLSKHTLISVTAIILLGSSQNALSQWTTNGNDIYYNTGKVGIGTPNPQEKLQITTNIGEKAMLLFSNGSSSYGRLTSEVTNWWGFTNNASYAGGNWYLDDTSRGGQAFALDSYAGGNQLWIGGFTAGANPASTRQWIGLWLDINNHRVGVGTTSPTAALHVEGDGKFTGNLTVDGNINSRYQDVAEWVASSEKLPTGSVVVLDSNKSNQVVASCESYDTRVAGVISEQPGIALGEKGESKVLVATTGRVRVKVDATRAPIHIGDLLVTSDLPGVAMKSEPVNLGGVQIHRPGTLIGKALEPLEKGSGTILVLLSLQ